MCLRGRLIGHVWRMLYRPKFCANCGEKIERIDWGLLTSRRFCQVCESEYKGQDLIPRAVVAGGVLVGVLGLGSYLSSPASETGLVRQSKSPVERPAAAALAKQPVPVPSSSANMETNSATQFSATAPLVGTRAQTPPSSLKTEVAEAQYFCGAETKKGTPCSRRVKGNVRCYQHVGMPSIVNAEKLKIN